MEIRDIIAQGFGIVGMLLFVFSLQARSNKNYFLVQVIGSICFIINYGLIGAFTGVFMNSAKIARNMILIKSDKRIWKLIVAETIYIIATVVTFEVSERTAVEMILLVLTSLSSLLGVYLLWLGDGKVIRYAQLFVYSPVWLAYNLVNFTLGGIICEIMSATSAVIAIYRNRKTGFTK